MDTQHEEKERSFLSSLSENHELALRRLSEKHRDRLASIDKSFLQQKQTVSKSTIFITYHLKLYKIIIKIAIFRLCVPEKRCYGN